HRTMSSVVLDTYLIGSEFLPSYQRFTFFFVFFLILRPSSIVTIFPYTTLFRSSRTASRQRLRGFAPDGKQSFKLIGSPVARCQRSEEHTSELQSRFDLVCRLLLEKKNIVNQNNTLSHIYVYILLI